MGWGWGWEGDRMLSLAVLASQKGSTSLSQGRMLLRGTARHPWKSGVAWDDPVFLERHYIIPLKGIHSKVNTR